MGRKRCAYGFNCAAMMQTPGLETDDCPNKDVCGIICELTEDERIELNRVREQQAEQARVSQREAAELLLMMRGSPQSVESLGVSEAVNQVNQKLREVRRATRNYRHCFIAPPECEVHVYNVKRPWGTYWYTKLSAQQPIFEPSTRDNNVRVVHLGKEDDQRHVLAREGIERRNQLLAARTKLERIKSELQEVLALLD